MDLAALRTSSRSKADEGESGFIDNSELTGFINQGCRLIYGKIAQKFEDYFIVPGTALNSGLFSTVSGTQGYNLPSTLMKLVRVEYRDSASTDDNAWIRMPRVNINNENRNVASLDWDGDLVESEFGYFVAGNVMYFSPVPDSAFSVRLWFIPRFTALSLDADVPGFPEEYHELAAEYGAIQCLRKSGESIWKESLDMFNLELTNMMETAEVRDHQPETMTITDWSGTGRGGFSVL